ncbi:MULTISPECIES: sulfurtransferase [unclassified Nitratiruptor]|uniref:sulfurtransferase n=1 Tax=unclassified Nitratiruptor TaxID=2624044 RepID=UPI001916524E|nr:MULTISPECIES: rhodanese-like domain-containing protein [unclassified Nitratiruptor]BCD60125.1 thiosulfate/3-mercaptopyruvate sulfurtransferase [Nitratiruptor sp. YY08-10]BCD64386.1 thiosulfate/3-mercaptopyruvate sulfurtransferase [Nitratiruptor sp. YY08-14]
MKKVILLCFSLALIAAEPFVSAHWLKNHLNDKNIVILDVSSPKLYKKEHIPNAINAPIALWRKKVGHYALLKAPKELEQVIRSLGITQNSHVILYSHRWGKDFLKTSYIAFALEAMGFANSSILDGGLDEYRKIGNLTNKIQLPKQSHFKATFHPELIADKSMVLAHIGKTRMIDARNPIFYFGAEKQKILARAGHIPKATSYFWVFSFHDEKIKDPKALHEMLIDGLGLDPDRPVITYCTGGLETSMNWYILHRVLGFNKVRLYDASMKEWANDPNTPLTKYRWE